MKTFEQTTAGPDDASRELTRRLADLAKADAPRFIAVVRAADAAVAAGADRSEALWTALEASSARKGSSST